MHLFILASRKIALRKIASSISLSVITKNLFQFIDMLRVFFRHCALSRLTFLQHASSITSIALSGRKRSLIYRADKSYGCLNCSGSISEHDDAVRTVPASPFKNLQLPLPSLALLRQLAGNFVQERHLFQYIFDIPHELSHRLTESLLWQEMAS